DDWHSEPRQATRSIGMLTKIERYTGRMGRAFSMRRLIFVFATAGLAGQFVTADDWPQFRGLAGDGTSNAQNLPTTWGGFESVTWQAEVPGHGWSSPVVVGDRVWLTTAEATALPTQRREKRLADSIYRDYRDQLQVHSSVTCYAVEIAAATGELLR